MSQTSQLLNTLKKCLKAKGINYQQLAQALSLSEASIKRLFSEKSFSIKRLEEICNILDLSFYDLAKISADADTGPNVLTIEQEIALAENPKLLVFYYPSSIVKDYKISSAESLQFLLKLDSLKLIELYPDNKVRFLTQQNIVWRKDGPIRKNYEKKIKEEFLNAQFDKSEERLSFETGKLSDSSQTVLLKKIDRLIKEYNELTDIDKALPQKQSHHTGLMIAFRPWVFTMLDDFKR